MEQSQERKLTRAEFGFVEHKLYSYPTNKQIIADYESQIDNMLHSTRGDDGQPRGSDIQKPTEITAIQLAILEQKAKCEMFWVKAVEDTLELLPEESKKLVQLKYFEAYLTNEGIMVEMGMDKNRFYRLREDIVVRFAKRFALI